MTSTTTRWSSTNGTPDPIHPPADPGLAVSEVPGQPGRVITDGPARWSSDSGLPDPITQKPALFPAFPSAYDDEEI